MGGSALLKLFVFNNTISKKEETQHENVLFYYPAAAPLDEKLMDIGMSGALSGLHVQFDEDTPVTAICCDGYGIVWVEPETEFRIGLAYRRDSDHTGYDDDVEHAKITWMLNHGYALFRMHFGCFGDHDMANLMPLKDMLARFWEGFIASFVKPAFSAGLVPLAHTNGVEYLGKFENYYLTIQSVANHVEELFDVHTAMVMIQDQVLYTGLNLDDTHTMYHYLAKRCKPSNKPGALDNVLQLSHPNVRNDDNYCGFLTPVAGAMFERHQSGVGKFLGRSKDVKQYQPIRVHMGPFHETAPTTDPRLTQHGLVVYQHSKAVFAFLAKPQLLDSQASPEKGGEFFKALENALQKFARHFNPSVSRSLVFDHSYQYWYTNKMNLAVKTSLKRKGADAYESLRNIESMKRFFDALPRVKTSWYKVKDNTWVCAVRSGNREFFAVFDGKPLNEANEEVKRMKAVLGCV